MIDDRNIDYLLIYIPLFFIIFLYRMIGDSCFFYPLYLIILIRIANTLFIAWNYVRLIGNRFIPLSCRIAEDCSLIP